MIKKFLQLILITGFFFFETRDSLGMGSRHYMGKGLIRAAEKGHTDTVDRLLSQGADVNYIDKFSNTPLIYAAQNGYPNVVARLLSQGAHVDQVGWYGNTPLKLAIRKGHADIVAQLLDHGANANYFDKLNLGYHWTPLIWAIAAGPNLPSNKEKMISALLDHGAKVNYADRSGRTALMYASDYGHSSILNLLLAHGADINRTNQLGETALMLFYESRIHTPLELLADVITVLVENGADVDIRNHQGKSALDLAHMLPGSEVKTRMIHVLENADRNRIEARRSLEKLNHHADGTNSARTIAIEELIRLHPTQAVSPESLGGAIGLNTIHFKTNLARHLTHPVFPKAARKYLLDVATGRAELDYLNFKNTFDQELEQYRRQEISQR